VYLAADESLVRFDAPAQSGQRPVLHRQPDTVQHEPAGFLRHAERPRDFVGADAVLIVDEHPDGREPLVQTDGRIFEDSPDLDRELLPGVLCVALPSAIRRQERDVLAPAGRAGDTTVRPSERRQEAQAHVGVSEEPDRLYESRGVCSMSGA